MRRLRRLLIPFVAMVSALGLGAQVGQASAHLELGDPPTIVVENGVTQPVFSYDDAISETLYVEAPMDSDFDGRNDLIAVDVMRPAETEQGMKVPSIMEASPYYGRAFPLAAGDPDARPEPDEPRGFLQWWDEFFVPRGYAIVEVEMQGTSRSEGCPSIGGVEDTISIKAAVDWLNGRAQAYYADGTEAVADWSTGDVGMQGVSYVGTLPNAVAVEGVPGLRTVVPIAAISNWYRYPRDQGIRYQQWGLRYPVFLANYVQVGRTIPGAVDACEDYVDWLGDSSADDTADFTPFWQERNYIPNANQVKTSKTAVFMVHGYTDFNVKPVQTSDLWYEIARRNMPRKIWIHRGGHSNPTSFRNTEWRQVMHRWMDHWLYRIENGIMDEPMADIQRPDGTWETDGSWPAPGTEDVKLRLGPATEQVAGTLSFEQAAGAPTQGFIDNWQQQFENTITTNPEQTRPNRLAYVTPPLESDVRISGTPRMEVRFSADSTSTPLSALLVDYGEAETTFVEDKSPFELVTETCSPEDAQNLTGCYEPLEATTVITPLRTITRGHIDGKNNVDLRSSEPLEPGESYNIDWEMQPHDYIVPAGNRIGLVLVGNYRASNGSNSVARDTLAEGNEITVHLNGSRLTLPVVGGRDTLGF